jgi:hypothetical protein
MTKQPSFGPRSTPFLDYLLAEADQRIFWPPFTSRNVFWRALKQGSVDQRDFDGFLVQDYLVWTEVKS